MLTEAYKSRITSILDTAIDSDVYVIVLGAFGCGAFNDPPKLISSAFRSVIYDSGYF